MKITYIEHSCFLVETTSCYLLFDYYKGELPEFVDTKRLYIFVSHQHQDHYNSYIFTYANRPNTYFILSNDIAKQEHISNAIYMGAHEQNKVDDLEIHTLQSTDEGVAFYVSLPEAHIYHAGDLHWWHWEEENTLEENEEAKKAYLREIALLQGYPIDIAFLPLDPRQEEQYDLGLDAFARLLQPTQLYPMHFWGEFHAIHRLLRSGKSLPYRQHIQVIERQYQSFVFEREHHE